LVTAEPDSLLLAPRILAPAEFQLALAKERMRSDRHGLGFALLILEPQATADPAGVSQPPSPQLRLAQLVRRRLRFTDECGLMEAGMVGALLPHTDREGARVVLESIVELTADDGLPLVAKIYDYPRAGTVRPPASEDSEQSGPTTEAASRRTEPAPTGAAATIPVAMSNRPPLHDPTPLLAPPFPRWKRRADIVVAGIGLVATSPIMVAAAVAIRFTSPGPILFRQWRIGHHGQPFRIVKLRTMVAEAEALRPALQPRNERDGPAFKMKADPRITPIGRFLRATGIDELPQLWNVLRGEMSIVGPRPLPCHEDAQCELWHRRRLDTKPGITCTWQIMKDRVECFDEWMRLDLQYLAQRSPTGDLRLMLKTVLAVLLGRVGH
jgi:lipopolysaccharide/colanic/teichoic acid biosynthesis glycosyltransferase